MKFLRATHIVVLCRRKQEDMESIRAIKAIMGKLDLGVNKEKLRLVMDDEDGFDFLGFHNRKFPMRNKGGSPFYVLCQMPSEKAIKKMRQLLS